MVSLCHQNMRCLIVRSSIFILVLFHLLFPQADATWDREINNSPAENIEGIAIWADGNLNPPGFALWDGSKFSGSKNMRSTDQSRWRFIRGAYSPTRDEAIVVGLQNDLFVTAQMWDGAGWTDLPFSPLTQDAAKLFYRPFDVRYESQSGNAIMVWHKGSDSDEVVYRVWNGSSWGSETKIDTPLQTDDHTEMFLEANPKSNEMVLAVRVSSNTDYAVVWNGESWGNGLNVGNTDGLGFLRSTNVVYEQMSGRAMVVYSGHTSISLRYRIWDGLKWSQEGNLDPPKGFTDKVFVVTIASDHSSNRIVVGVTSYSDFGYWLGVWDGVDEWVSVLEVSSRSLEPKAIAVSFEGISGKALAVYDSSDDDVEKLNLNYRTWSNQWSDEQIGSHLDASAMLMTLSSSPGSNEVMLAVQDAAQAVYFSVWDGVSWDTPHKMTNRTGDYQGNKPFLFLWKRTLPTPVPIQGTRDTGQVCSNNVDCKSNTCRGGVCMASPECYPIKHRFGTPFDKHRINVVFVPSAFDTESHEAWHAQVNNTYEGFESFNMFSKDVEELNVFLVDPEELDRSYCKFGCIGIDRLLCCDIRKAHELASKCFSVGENLQTVVIHNSPKYGGAGYSYQNIATVSAHPQASSVAVHELGHSLFRLADEYTYGPGTGVNPNCDSSRKCNKWSDLVGEENTPDGYEPVQCLPGCRNGNFFIGTKSFMDNLDLPVGAVNERFTCCTYQVLTKSMPAYCNAFESSADYLFNYCKNNDYQGYGSSNYEVEQLAIPGTSEVDSNARYVYVSHPVLVTITSRTRPNGKVRLSSKQTPLQPGIFLRSQVEGDFSNAKAAAKKGGASLLKVVVNYSRTGKEVLLFSQNVTIDVPLPLSSDDETAQQHNEPDMVSEKSNVIEVVLDTKERSIRRIRSTVMETPSLPTNS